MVSGPLFSAIEKRGRRPGLPHGALPPVRGYSGRRLAVQFAPVAGENFQKNLALVDGVREIAREKGVKPSELALAWVLAQGEEIVPIPGTAHRDHLEENTAALGTVLSHEDLRRIDTVAPQKSRRRRALHRGGHVPCERVRLPTSPVMRRLKSVVMGTVPPCRNHR